MHDGIIVTCAYILIFEVILLLFLKIINEFKK